MKAKFGVVSGSGLLGALLAAACTFSPPAATWSDAANVPPQLVEGFSGIVKAVHAIHAGGIMKVLQDALAQVHSVRRLLARSADLREARVHLALLASRMSQTRAPLAVVLLVPKCLADRAS